MITQFEVSTNEPRTVIEAEVITKPNGHLRTTRVLFIVQGFEEAEQLAEILNAYRAMQCQIKRLMDDGGMSLALYLETGELLIDTPAL